MTDALTPQPNAPLQFTLCGLILHRDPTIEEWLEGMRHLQDAQKAIRWNLGDMLIFGEHKWGEMYAQALECTEYSYHTLTQYVRVCRAFPIERRRPDVNWTHYQKLAALPEPQQESLLDEIESGEIFTTAQTGERVKEERDNGHKPADELPDPAPEVIYPPCPVCKEPLRIARGRCAACEATINEMAYNYRDLEADYSALLQIVLQFTRDGVIEPLKTFVSAYNSQEAQ
jgi:hypothetical protein